MSQRPIRSTIIALGLFGLACASGSAAPPGDGDVIIAPAGTRTQQMQEPGTFLTPQPGASLDINEARRLESEGNLDGAVGIYVNIISTGSPQAADATIAAARLLLELERPDDVRVLLEPFVVNASGDYLAARYLLARAYSALNLWTEALTMYDLYIQTGRAAVPYAQLDRANVLAELSRPLEAAISSAEGANLGVPASMRRAFILSAAQNYERGGNFLEAIRNYRLLIDSSDLGSDHALALSRIEALKRLQGDPTYVDELRQLLVGYPSTQQALITLQEAAARGEYIDPNVQGLVHYRHNDYTQAEPFFQNQVNLSPNAPASAMAYYYLGAIVEARGELDAALANYARVPVLDPTSLLAEDNSLWWRGRILEERGSRDEAAGLYARIVNEYPNSSWAPDAAFRRGMIAYGAGRYQEAANTWAQSLLTTASTYERERLTIWQGKALQKAGNPAAAAALLQPLAVSGEDDYHGIRSAALLQGRSGQPKSVLEPNLNLNPAFDWAGAEAWLSLRTGFPVAEGAWAGDVRWLRAQELWRVGRVGYGDAEAFDLIEAYAQDPIAMYTISRRLGDEGRIGMSGRAGQRLLRVLNANPNEGLPKAMLSLSYPAAFGTMAQQHAQAAGISPLLMLAFIRQESFFDPRAQSPVGALGLTQVLPVTAQAVATRLGLLSPFGNEDLLHADLNLQLGSKYMAEQIQSFGGEIFVAFAAYNAGPNAAAAWRASAGAEDADVFLEAVAYDETRLYVEIVSENYAIYRYLYGGEATPTLP